MTPVIERDMKEKMVKEDSKFGVTLNLALLIVISSACSVTPSSTLPPTPEPTLTRSSPFISFTQTPALTAPSSLLPTPSPTRTDELARGRIAFTSDLDGDFELYVMNIDG